MIVEREDFLSVLTVKIQQEDLTVTGTGYIYYAPVLKDKVYIITAAHCLYADRDGFKQPLKTIHIGVYSPNLKGYANIEHSIDYNFVSANTDKDAAVLILNKSQIEDIIGNIPELPAICERQSITSFIIKGFPNATRNEELASIQPTWVQALTSTNRFQIQLNEDYTDWGMGGFSGSGVLLQTKDQIYLYGIFTRYRSEGKGKVIYCQYLETFNEILESNFRPLIQFSFLGNHGLTVDFFKKHIEIAIENLGPRFNKAISFRMPIVQRFNELAKDNTLKKKFLNCFDNWLLSKGSRYSGRSSHPLLKDIEEEYQRFQKTVLEWTKKHHWHVETPIVVDSLIDPIREFTERTEKEMYKLHDLKNEQRRKDGDKTKEYSYKAPYEDEIYRLRQIIDNNHKFFSDLSEINLELLNHPVLIIHGEAGCGKSHLLGDIAKERSKRGLPTLLLLGQLFKGSQSVWQNILSQLNITCTKEEFLSELNSIGRQKGSRVLLLFDALNEGSGKELWPGELAGFIKELSTYKYIGLAFTVRSTYYELIVPANVKTDKNVTKIEHKGFKGSEYEALRLFCEHYDLTQPSFPILTPEFTNPLFLILICEGVRASGQKNFPQGFQGVTGLFNYYIKAITKKLSEKREEYALKSWLSKQAIEEVARACFAEKENRLLPLDKAVALFETKFSAHPNLLLDLIQDSVFIQTTYKDYKSEQEYNAIYFAYERFGDFFMAEQLLQPFRNATEVKAAFEKGGQLGELAKDIYWRNGGIIEAFSVILPEKYSLEIYEVFDWVFTTKNDHLMGNTDDWLNTYLIDSLKWRNPANINDEKLVKWFQSGYFNMSDNDILYRWIELTAVHAHPFNSDRLFNILNRSAMPERDAFWQMHLYYHNGKTDNGEAFPINRLIEWAWLPNISRKTDPETARLVSQTLAWVLASTNLALRDKATKALVNLLEEQPKVLILILDKFNACDDLYIKERLYAVAYGCVLRTSKNESVQLIAQCVYDHVFKDNNPPTHVLLRDYARNTIEYALYKQLPVNVDEIQIRPPYNSKMPEKMPTKEEVKKFELDYTSEDYKKDYGQMHNRIHHSVMGWDFGRYTVKSALRSFGAVSFTLEKEYKDFYKELSRKQKETIKLYATTIEYLTMTEDKQNQLKAKIGEKEFNEFYDLTKNISETCNKELEEILSETQHQFFITKGTAYLNSVQRKKSHYNDEIFKLPFLCWITERAYNLGYNAKIHGQYDSTIERFNDRSENKIERIGKKYQWIALHEMIAMVSDNYQVKDDYGTKKYDYFKGPWQMYLRDVDPAYTTLRQEVDEEDDRDELGVLEEPSAWWLDSSYSYWDQPDSQWISNALDLPNIPHILSKVDDAREEWLYLDIRTNWNEPKPMGKDKYKVQRKAIWYSIQSHLVNLKDKSPVLLKYQNHDFWNTGIHEDENAHGLINREKYWSPAFKEMNKNRSKQISKRKYKMIGTTTNAVGEMSDDKSGAHQIYKMPCQVIFDGMGLQYAPKDGDFKNENGDIIVTGINPKGVLVRKKEFLAFLKSKGFALIWTVMGEKSSTGESYEYNRFRHIGGVYSLNENNKVEGSVQLFPDRDL